MALFAYNQQAAAEQKAAELMAKAKGEHFLQIVKIPMLEPAPIIDLAANLNLASEVTMVDSSLPLSVFQNEKSLCYAFL